MYVFPDVAEAGRGLESPPTPEAPLSVAYQTLLEATDRFCPLAYGQGGHKLGEGEYGEVFHSTISLAPRLGTKEIAVKVLKNTVSHNKTCIESGHSDCVSQVLVYMYVMHRASPVSQTWISSSY